MKRKLLTLPLLLPLMLPLEAANADLLSDGLKLLGGKQESGQASGGSQLSVGELTAGLKEALRVGSEKVVDQVSVQDGYNGDSQIHIPLPENLKSVQSALRTGGLSSVADELELKLNRGAEEAAVEARALFVDAITQMTLEDAQRIYDGRDNEATLYFKDKMSPSLREKFLPIIERTLSEVGALSTYDEMMSEYKSIPFVPDVRSDLTDYTVTKALDGLFYYLAVEEEQIRKNPVARTTEILKDVFGS